MVRVEIEPLWSFTRGGDAHAIQIPLGLLNEIRLTGKIGRAADRAVPELVKLLADSETEVRETAAEALARVDRNWRTSAAARQTLHDLVKRLSSSDAAVSS